MSGEKCSGSSDYDREMEEIGKNIMWQLWMETKMMLLATRMRTAKMKTMNKKGKKQKR